MAGESETSSHAHPVQEGRELESSDPVQEGRESDIKCSVGEQGVRELRSMV